MSVPLESDVRALAALMVEFGLEHLEWHGSSSDRAQLVLRRPTALILAEYAARQPDPEKKPGEEEQPDDLTRLKTMTEDERDAALALAPLPRMP